MKRIVLLRHGQSTWNKENRFTGWTDVDLTQEGVAEAVRAGELLRDEGFTFGKSYTSYLKRAVKTLDCVLDKLDEAWIPVEKSWRLNEKHYGMLQGLNKSETAEKYGEEQVHVWRRSYDVAPDPLPEDDPRNPATIADNVGDNVGDVAGMGADLYESYCGSVLATAALGAAAFATADGMAMQLKAVLAPMLIAAVGIVLSIIGIFLVRTREGASMRELLRSLGVGVNFSSLLIAGATFGILYLLGIQNWLGLSCSVITGLVAGIIIGQATEYYTSHSYKPTQKIAGSAQTGPATVIIAGVGSGMISTAIPVLTIGAAIILAYLCAIGFDMENMMAPMNMSLGLYGIGIAAVGMLSTLGITLATDAYGPIADNAGGNAEMSGLGPEVRKRTDALELVFLQKVTELGKFRLALAGQARDEARAQHKTRNARAQLLQQRADALDVVQRAGLVVALHHRDDRLAAVE